MTSGLAPFFASDMESLIECLTGFEREEENFGLCYDYAMSNLLYHHCLDPQEKTLRKSLNGLAEKFSVHAQREKSQALEAMVEQLRLHYQHNQQQDLGVRLLSLLWHLSDSALHYQWEKIDPLNDPKTTDKVEDWRAVLAAGEEVYQLSPERELSPWTSEDEENSNEEDTPHPDDGLVNEGLINPTSQLINLRKMEEARSHIRHSVQSQYWNLGASSEQDSKSRDLSDGVVHFSEHVDKLMRKSGISVGQKFLLTEYQVIRECLWMVRSPMTSNIFYKDSKTGRFEFHSYLHISSVTAQTLKHYLGDFCYLLTRYEQLTSFCNKVLSDASSEEEQLPCTFQAYASYLDEVLQYLSSKILAIEKDVASQKSAFTLFDLFDKLSGFSKILDFLHEAHQTSVNHEESCNWKKSLKLLSGLHQFISRAPEFETCALMLTAFVRSLQPYTRIADLWIREGRTEDFRSEFLICRNDSCPKEDFWSRGIVKRPYEKYLLSENLEMPLMLKTTLDKLMSTCKSVEVMTSMKGFHSANEVNSSVSNQSQLDQEFLLNIEKEIAKFKPISSEGIIKTVEVTRVPHESNSESLLDLSDLGLDPYLELALKSNFQDTFSPNQEEKEIQQQEEEISNTLPTLFSSSEIDHLLPLHLILEQSFSPFIEKYYQSTSKTLLSMVTEQINVKQHLSSVRRVYLLEAGDLMSEFCCEMFTKLREEPECLDSCFVTLILRDCLGKRYPAESDNFTFDFDLSSAEKEKEMSQDIFFSQGILSYEMEWPLNFILSKPAMKMYNTVFLFLLQVKQSMWILQQIDLKYLAKMRTPEIISSSSLDDEDEIEEEKPPQAVIVQRLLLLRSWMLYFIGNIHGYFMTRILHSTEIELNQTLDECQDLDQLITAHYDYITKVHDRCFFHSSAKVLKETVKKILQLPHELQRLCSDGIEKINLEQLRRMEATYAQSHEFLASTLHTMTQKSNVPHLDGLAAALVHSTPTLVL